MKALILYRSFFGNTKQVADAIAQEIQTLGNEPTIQDVRQKFPDLHGVDSIVVGAPTRGNEPARALPYPVWSK